MKIELGSEI